MFTRLIETGWIDEWIEEAKIESRAEDAREEHRSLHDIILNFFSQRKDWVIDEPQLLTNPTLILRIFTIFTDQAARTSNQLANVIVGKYPFIVLRTIEPKYHFILSINGQDVANIRDLSRLMQLKFLNPMLKEYPTGDDVYKVTKTWKLPVIPPDVYLLELYHKRYNPAYHEDWDDLDKQIEIMTKLMEEHVGGSAPIDHKIQKGINYIRRELLNRFQGSTDVIISGQYVLNVLQKRKEMEIPSMQLISKVYPRDLAQQIKQWFETDNMRLNIVQQQVYAPFDFRLEKFTIYVKVAGDQRPLLDIFNSACYEQVPYFIKDKVQYAHPLVVLRFVYLDVWILRIMLQDGKIDTGKLRLLMAKKATLAKEINKFNQPMISWLGSWTNEATDYKIMALRKREQTNLPTYPYKPYIYMIKHGYYRDF